MPARRPAARRNPNARRIADARYTFVKAAADAFGKSEGEYWGQIFDDAVGSDRDVIELARDLVASSISGGDVRVRTRAAEMAYDLLRARSEGE